MNIANVSSPSFNGFLAIQHPAGFHRFNVKEIVKIAESAKKRGILISGKDIAGQYTRIHMPKDALNLDRVLKAYRSAQALDKGTIVLKTDKPCMVKVRG